MVSQKRDYCIQFVIFMSLRGTSWNLYSCIVEPKIMTKMEPELMDSETKS